MVDLNNRFVVIALDGLANVRYGATRTRAAVAIPSRMDSRTWIDERGCYKRTLKRLCIGPSRLDAH